MGAITIVTDVAGQVAQHPRRVKLISTDNFATVTAANYLNSGTLEGYAIYPTDVIDLIYSYNPTTQSGTYTVCTVSISNGVITLVAWASSGDVTLPVTNNYLAVFDGTSGKIKQGTNNTTVFNPGSIASGTAAGVGGTFIAYSPTAAKGSFSFSAQDNTGNSSITLTHATMGQSTTFIVPDPAGAAGFVAIAAASLVNNNLIKASGTAGLIADSGIVASTVQLSTNIKAGFVNIGGAGVGPNDVTVAGLTSSSIVVPVSSLTSNVTTFTYTVTTGKFVVTYAADPGAIARLYYVAFIAPQ